MRRLNVLLVTLEVKESEPRRAMSFVRLVELASLVLFRARPAS